MKKIILSFLMLAIFTGIGISQQETEDKTVEKKMIIIKTIDDEGNVTTEVLDGDEAEMEGAKVWVTEEGDSIKVEVEIEEDGDMKKIEKRIIIEDFEGLEEIEGLEDFEKNIEFYEFDDEFGPGQRRMLWMDEFGGPHAFPEGKIFMFNDEPDKARLGVMIEDADKGVKVTEVVENSSAWSVGILAGDVITEVDGKKMTNVEELQRAITDHEIGDMVNIKLKRNGKNKKFTARLQGSQNQFEFQMPQGFNNGMKRMKHHFYRSMDELENNPRFNWKHKKDCDKKCTGDHKRSCKKEFIIDEEIKIEDKKKEMEEKMIQIEEQRTKEFEMQKNERKMLEREIERSEDDSNNK